MRKETSERITTIDRIWNRNVKGTIGLALSGGGARGFAHIGVLQELKRAGVAIDYIAGTSSGALVGALYASGVNPENMTEYAPNITWRDLVIPHPTRRSIISGERIITFLEKYCQARRFENLEIPLSVVVSDLETGASVSITTGDLFPAILASCSIPLVFPPVTLNGREYIDGGFAALIPVKAVREMGADLVIACDVNYNSLSDLNAGNFISMLVKLMVLVAHKSIEEAKLQADVVINVDARGIGLAALGKVEELLQRGRQAAREMLPEIRKNISN